MNPVVIRTLKSLLTLIMGKYCVHIHKYIGIYMYMLYSRNQKGQVVTLLCLGSSLLLCCMCAMCQ